VRSRLLPEFTAAPPAAAGRVVLITGATSGIGQAAAALAPPGRGRFWHDRRRRPEHLLPWTREAARARDLLWDRCARAAAITPLVPFGLENDTGGLRG
jgi:NAD(P)-dependent dehydrogenase (short-subunit alcohol dehydrogenase family)